MDPEVGQGKSAYYQAYMLLQENWTLTVGFPYRLQLITDI